MHLKGKARRIATAAEPRPREDRGRVGLHAEADMSNAVFPVRGAALPTSRDLEAEHQSHDDLDQALRNWLEAQGVSAQAIASPWPIKAATVRLAKDGRFDRDPDGVMALTIAVIDHGEIVDLAAWHAGSGRLATWLGVGFALGQAQIFEAATYMFDSPLLVHRTPLGWLRAKCRGIVILRPELAYGYLAHVEHIEAEDEAHEWEIRKLVRPPEPRVRFTFRQRSAAA
jgi:hypothetical protein